VSRFSFGLKLEFKTLVLAKHKVTHCLYYICSLDAIPSTCNACLHHNSIQSGCDLDLWPLTLKTFSAIATHTMNIFAKFHWNLSTKHRDVVSHKIGVDGPTYGQPDVRPEYIMHPFSMAEVSMVTVVNTMCPLSRQRHKVILWEWLWLWRRSPGDGGEQVSSEFGMKGR